MNVRLRHAALCCALSLTAACASSPTTEDPDTSPLKMKDAERTAPLLEGMGNLHWPISTESELAQRYFDQALTLAYGFNQLEADEVQRLFETAWQHADVEITASRF